MALQRFHTSPTEVLFSAYHRRILALLLSRPDESFHVREIARLADVPAGSLHRELKLFSESGILLRKPAGNQVRYRANRECPIFPELAGILRKTVGLADVLREALASLAAKVDVAFIFGSVAQGKERVTSDVDVFVIGKTSFASVVRVFAQTNEQLGREVNPVVIPRDLFRKKLKEGDHFVARVIKEPKLFLIGTANDLGKLAKDRPAQKPHRARQRNSPAVGRGAA